MHNSVHCKCSLCLLLRVAFCEGTPLFARLHPVGDERFLEVSRRATPRVTRVALAAASTGIAAVTKRSVRVAGDGKQGPSHA